MSAKIDVLIVDDSSFVRRALRRVLAESPDVRVVGDAPDGDAAIALCRERSPRVVLLDLEMPVRDGLSTLEALRHLPSPPEVIVVSASAQPGAERTLLALEHGAFDFVDKSQVSAMELHTLGASLLDKIRHAAAARTPVAPEAATAIARFPRPEVLLLAASTGGPPALGTVLQALPRDLPVPVVLVQHMPANFVAPFAERLATRTPLRVRLAEDGAPLQPGTVHVTPGGTHAMLARVRQQLVLRTPEALAGELAPSADLLFRSAATVCGGRVFAALLTGMGRDGAEGLLALRRAGALTIAQDRATSAVDGMPRAARELCAAVAVLPLQEVSRQLLLALDRAEAGPSQYPAAVPPQEVAR